MKHAIITGATGAIGIALINKLIEHDIVCKVIVRPDSPRKKQIPVSPLVRLIECDLSDLLSTGEKISTGDVFYHLGWEGTFGSGRNDMYLQNRNVKYTLDAVNLAKSLGCHTFIGAGSQAEYGRVDGLLSPKVATNPENGYGMAKLCAGQMSRVVCNEIGIKHIWTRILSVYGPYDGSNTMIMTLIRKLLNGQTPELTLCEQQWDYLYAKDAAHALYLMGLKGINNATYCLGSGNAHPLSYYVNIIKNKINPDAQLGIGTIPYSPNQVMSLCADISSLTKDTGFMPQYDFEKGIEETILWLENNSSL